MKNIILHIRVPHSIDQALKAIAGAEDRSVNYIVNRMLAASIPSDLLNPITADLADAEHIGGVITRNSHK
jgi:predicted transcriptional regulator